MIVLQHTGPCQRISGAARCFHILVCCVLHISPPLDIYICICQQTSGAVYIKTTHIITAIVIIIHMIDNIISVIIRIIIIRLLIRPLPSNLGSCCLFVFGCSKQNSAKSGANI